MADINGSNYTLEYINVPTEQSVPGESGGRVKCMWDSWSGAAGSDVVYYGVIPAGARILRLSETGGGTAPTFSIAVGAKLAVATTVTLTLDGDGAATGTVFAEYLLD